MHKENEMTKIINLFKKKNQHLVELFINEYRSEYEYAREMRIPVTSKYVKKFLENQNL